MKPLSQWVDFNPKVKLEKGKEYPFIGMDQLTPGIRYVRHNQNKIYLSGGARFCNGDVLFARITPCLQNGKVSQYLNEDNENSCAFGSTEFFILRARSGIADPSFIYYLSQTDLLRESAIQSMVGASGRQRADIKSLSNLILSLPNYDEQKRIGNFLSQYDNLIENNRKRITLLEEHARLLYQEWFVKFRFPNIASKKDNLLPQNWGKMTVGQLTSFLSRGITPKYDENAQCIVINQKCIRDGLLNLELSRRQSKEVKSERLVQKGDILINSTGAGTLGRVAVIRSNIPNCTVDTHITIVRPLDNNKSAYLAVTLLELESLLSSMGVGATNQQELNRADIAALPIIEPPEKLQIRFNEIVWPIFEQTETLLKMNKNLQKARDELLSKLISGQIKV
ncbi:restriction endonuclease subunit S [Snodgrassella sp. B3800]|uniref:restriction endonuclease subunit S n=1 Tax=Snodgrassella sp. B3800 TaxID=2818039 RepID=UPI00226A6689|nr:restriction endonuclease subunit S [Snodgrassella sp. B3800]MCX8745858.1 restriction endonuclease subunit S [Snodgrassella sp. B3800]